MKKTLITLLALGGLAMGATTTITLDDASKTNAVIVTAELSLEQLTTILWTNSTNTALIGLTDSGSNEWSTVVGTWGSKQEMLIVSNISGGESLPSSAGNLYYSGTNYPSDKNVGGYFTQTNAVKGAITLAYGGNNVSGSGDTGTAICVSVLYADNTIKTMYGVRTGQKWSENNIKQVTYANDLIGTPDVVLSDVRWTEASLTEAHRQLLVPEPTTATLSLLALCGLCARRRRK